MSSRIFGFILFALLALLALLVSAPALASNAGPTAELAAAEQAYQGVDFPATRDHAQRALESGRASREQTARLHVLLGISAAALGHADDSKSHFVVALAVDPTLHLDKNLSPKLRDPYLEAQGYWSATGERLALRAAPTADGAHLVVRLRDPASLVAKVELQISAAGSREHAQFSFEATAVTRFALPARLRERDYEYVLQALDRFGNVLTESGSDSEPELVRRAPSGDSGSPAPHAARSYLLPATLAVAGLGAVAVGIVFNAKREQAAHEWNGPGCEHAGLTRQQQCQSVDSRIQSDERLSVGFYAGGGALLAGSVIALFAGRTVPTPPERASALGCDFTGSGVSCRGHF